MLRFPAFENQTLKRPEWALASDLALATWLKVATQGALAENGGRFVGASAWDDRAWTVMAGVTKAGIDAAVAAGICAWEGEALVVVGYETKAEIIVQQRREHGRLSPGRPPKKAGKNHAATRTGNRADNQTVNHKGNHARKALSSPSPSDPLPSDPPPLSLIRGRENATGSPQNGSDPLPPVATRSRVYLGAKTAAFLSVAEQYPTQHRVNEASQVWAELVAARGGNEDALAAEILRAFRRGFLRRHPYDGEPRFVPKLETFLANQSWQERAPRAAAAADDAAYPEEP
jgi:hypothetical protein